MKGFEELHTCISGSKTQSFGSTLLGNLPHVAFAQLGPFTETFVTLTFEVSCRELGTSQHTTRIPWVHSGLSTLVISWQEEDEFIVEGLLNISWGLRRPIRLQMQDDHERIRPPPSSSSWHSGCNLGAQG